jgi:hypothetical protein
VSRGLVVIAWIGVATTALNTLILPSLGVRGPLLDAVLLAHALATLLPVLGLALVGCRRSPLAAVVAAVLTAFEKLFELVGQSLRLFPPEEVLGGVPAAEVVAAIWDQLYFVLWLANTLGASAVGWLLLRARGGRRGWIAAACAWAAALSTLLMLLGPDYVALSVPPVPRGIFFVTFTAYRIAVALELPRAAWSNP